MFVLLGGRLFGRVLWNRPIRACRWLIRLLLWRICFEAGIQLKERGAIKELTHIIHKFIVVVLPMLVRSVVRLLSVIRRGHVHSSIRLVGLLLGGICFEADCYQNLSGIIEEVTYIIFEVLLPIIHTIRPPCFVVRGGFVIGHIGLVLRRIWLLHWYWYWH